jgi:hypothetical protein
MTNPKVERQRKLNKNWNELKIKLLKASNSAYYADFASNMKWGIHVVIA